MAHPGMSAVVAGVGLLLALTQSAPSSAEQDATPYQIIGGKVDRGTYNGFRRYSAICHHCHGPDGIGGTFGPSLIATPSTVEEFRAAVLNGRANGTSVMKGFADDPNVAPYIDDIYSYLRARADGAVGRGRPLPADER